MRTPSVVRILAAGRGSATVGVKDIGRAIGFVRESFEAAAGGFAKYMRRHFLLGEFCDEVVAALVAAGGFPSSRDLNRKFGRNQKFGNELDRALIQLRKEERIAEERRSDKGPAAKGWRVLGVD